LNFIDFLYKGFAMRRIPFEIWFAAIVIAAHLYVALLPANSLVNWFHSDDAFYYFKVAQNITEGRGITFDGIGRDSGFHPLWMLLVTPLFALARFDLILPLRLVVLLSAVLSGGAAILLYRLSRRVLHPYAAGLIAFFWVFHPVVHQNITEMGLESALSGFMIVLLIYRLVLEHEAQTPSMMRWLVTGLVAAFTVLARLDNVFLVLVAGLWIIFPPTRLRYLLTADIVLITFGVLVGSYLRVGLGPPAIPYLLASQVMVLVALTVRIPVYYFLDLYVIPDSWTGLLPYLSRGILASLLSTGIIVTLMLALQFLSIFPGFARVLLVYEGAFALAVVLLTRLAAVVLARRSQTVDEPLRWASVLTRAGCFFVPVGLLLITYMGSSYVYFGTFMPVSGQIKRWWGTLYTIYGHPIRSIQELLGCFNYGPWHLARKVIGAPASLPEVWRALLYGVPAALLLLRPGYRTRFARSFHTLAIFPLLAGGLLHMISYTGTSYAHMRGWYWSAQMILTALVLGIMIDTLVHWLSSLSPISKPKQTIPPAAIVTAALCALLVIACMTDVIKRMPIRIDPDRSEAYLHDTRVLEESTEPGSIIGFTGGGTTAYFIHDRTIVNLDGLMNTYEYFQALKKWQGASYLDQIGLQYVVAREYVITRSEPYIQFEGRLEEIMSIGENAFYRWKTIPQY
jgi:hypothetical protein